MNSFSPAKINNIESISNLKEIFSITTVILESINLTEITQISDDILIGSSVYPGLGKQSFAFVHTLSPIKRGDSEYQLLEQKLRKLLTSGSYSKIYIVSNKYISHGLRGKLNYSLGSNSIEYWDRGALILKIDELYEDYWRHSDQALISYEKIYVSDLQDDWAFNKLKQFKEAHLKLYNIFIEPRLYRKTKDRESPNKVLELTNIEKIKDIKLPLLIEGDPGSGKTRLLREIGRVLINDNVNKSGKKSLPIFLNIINLLEAKDEKTNIIDLNKVILQKVGNELNNLLVEDLINQYELVILIDIIDELNEITQKDLLLKLKNLIDKGCKLVLGTRTTPSDISSLNIIGKYEEVYVQKFSDKQVRQFLTKYFSSNNSHAEELIESLQENKILERLPITPLNLSLISILYEENNFEIPATITDIYDNFSNLLLGRSTVDTRLKFFDITIKERILSKYAFEVLSRSSNKLMTKDDFINYFIDFFTPVSGTIDLKLLPEALEYLIQSTGILVLEEDKYVRFRHESYMEYYASREIFSFNRAVLEEELVEKFFDLNWQYTAIFYAGRSKDMPVFLEKIIKKVQGAKTIADYWKSISGLGYLIQALYLTSDELRKLAVLTASESTVQTFEAMKKLGSSEVAFFKNLTLPVAAITNSLLFLENFNSITVKNPLDLAFKELLSEYKSLENTDNPLKYNIAFKLFNIALTFSSKRLNDLSKMEELIYSTNLLNDQLYSILFEFGTSIAGSKELYDLKKEVLKLSSRNKDTSKTIKLPVKTSDIFIDSPVGQLRFSSYDRIRPNKKVRILTEGKTDALIIEHAFGVLTNNSPYWTIVPTGINDTGGASELTNALMNAHMFIKEDEIIIGIYDNDEKGIQEFGALKKSRFELWRDHSRVKKNIDKEIYGFKLPVPPSMEHYLQDEQRYNIFSIEHYFSEQILKANDLILDSPISNTFKIKDSKKTAFAKKIVQNNDIAIFSNFIHLFKQIDLITGINDIEYL